MKARFFALAALVLGLASCQNDFDGANVGVGGEVDFQLAVSAPEFGATRADADGSNGHDSAFGAIDYLSQAEWDEVDLRYTLEVYDYDPATKTIGDAPVKDRMVKVLDKYEPVVFDLRLVPNRHYHFVVFADFVVEGAEETPTVEAQATIGKHHIIGATLADITLNADAINNELTDAYFAAEQFEITNSAAKDMVLRRPYGKVRVVATDLHELNLNVEATSVKVEYTAPNANKFNAVTGEISGNGATTFTAIYNNEYTAGYDALTTTALNGTTRYSHMTLSTDYILATDEQTPIHFTVTVYEDENGEQPIKETAFSTDIPVKRNHLTTVIGNVLTTATEINVSIDDNFYGEIKNNMVLVSSADELQEAIDAFENGQVILFDGDIDGDVTVLQKEGLNVVIDGNNYKYDGVITVNGDARANGAETLTFRNINFETSGSDFTFISAPSKINNKYNYSHNVTVENCTFKGNHTVGCVSFTGTYNFVMRECEAENVHSIAQFQSCDNTVLVEDITVTNSKSGLSFGNTAYPTLRNAVIEATGYGVRGDGNASRGNLILENVDIDAYVPVVIRKVTTAGYTVNIDDESTLVAPGYHVVFTKGQDDATFEAPAVEFTVNGADEYNVFPRDNDNFVYTAADLQAAVAAGGAHTLMPTTIEGTFNVNKPISLTGVEGATIKGRVNVDSAATGSSFENIKFAINDASKVKQVWTGAPYQYPAIVNIRQAATTFDGCEFETDINVGVCGINYGNAYADRLLTVNACKFEGDFYPIRTRVVFNITNCEFVSTYQNNGLAAVWSWGLGGDHGTANFSNNTCVSSFEFYGVQATASNYAYSNTTFTFANNNGFATEFVTSTSRDYTNSTVNGNAIVASAAKLTEALNNGETDVYLLSGEYTMPAVTNDVTISGTRNTVITVNKPNMSGTNVTFNGVTVKGSGYATGVQHVNTVTYNDVKVIGEMCLYGEAVTFNNCEFELNNQYIWTYGCRNTTFENCVFNTNGKAILVYNEGNGACNVTVNECTFNATAGAKAGAIANQNCAAVEIDNFQSSGVGAAHNVTTSNNTCNSNFSGEWRIKNFVSGNPVTVNGVEYTQIAVDGQLMSIDASKNVTIL